MNYQAVAQKVRIAGKWAAVLLGASIPVSTPPVNNILLGLIAIFWLASGDIRDKAAAAGRNRVAVAALILFGLLAAGTSYGDAVGLWKYIDLLFVPILVAFFQEETTRRCSLAAFCAFAITSVVVSDLAYLNLLATNPWLPRNPSYPVGFKYSITHSLIAALAAYLLALWAREEQNKMRRMVYIALALFVTHNVVFIVMGRTGYLVLAFLFLYFFVVTFGRRGLIPFAAAAVAIFLTAYIASSTFHERIDTAIDEGMNWQAGNPSGTSVGLRLEFYRNSLELVRAHPLLGYGTGSFAAAYARAVEGSNMVATQNPHNEYLLITIQIGLLGLLSLVYLFYAQWRTAGQLAEPFYRDLGRGLVLMFGVGCLFNSLLLDHTEGLLFAWMSALVFSSPMRPAPERTP